MYHNICLSNLAAYTLVPENKQTRFWHASTYMLTTDYTSSRVTGNAFFVVVFHRAKY